MPVSIAFHLLGLVFWIGGLLFASSIIKYAPLGGPTAIQTLSKKTLFGYIVPGLLLMISSGLYQLMTGGLSVYMKQGWMHTKLTFIVILIWSTIMLSLALIRISKGQSVNPKIGSIHHGIVALCLTVIIFLTIIKPF